MKIEKLPKKIKPLFQSKKRFIILYGGRGSSKSWSIATFLILLSLKKKIRVLCTREIQKSLKDSVFRLLDDTIERYGLENYFKVVKDSIIAYNGSMFIFKGLWNNENDIKSTEGIDYCWVEEAHSVSRKSLEVLTPTIRKEGSQIIFSYNPTNETDPVDQDYTTAAIKGTRDDCELININWSDNKYFPEVLKAELEYDKRTDYGKYLHKWEGHKIVHSAAQIFYNKWAVQEFDYEELFKEKSDRPPLLFGADWGFQDPTCAVRLFSYNNFLFVEYEAYGVNVEIPKYPELFDSIPEIRKHKIKADSARPENINYMQNSGFFIVPAKKGSNSVLDGIDRLKSYEKIIVHPRCKHFIDELTFYLYKIDKRTGIISTVPEDKHNHLIDSARYATEDEEKFNPESFKFVQIGHSGIINQREQQAKNQLDNFGELFKKLRNG